MHVIKPIMYDQNTKEGVYILVSENGIDIEFMENLNDLFEGRGVYYTKTSHLEIVFERSNGKIKIPAFR